MATYSSILAWKLHGQKSQGGYSPCGHRESDMTEHTHTHTHTHTHEDKKERRRKETKKKDKKKD